jgi:exopolysaccharide biosynthesis polyprenyl glycosylphosphotransferase
MNATQPGTVDGGRTTVVGFSAKPRLSRFGARWSALLFGLDVVSLGVATLGAQFVTGLHVSSLAASPGAFQTALLAAAIWLVLFERLGMYRQTFATTARDEMYGSIAATAMAMLPAFVLLLLVPALEPFRRMLLTTLVFTMAAVTIARVGAAFVRANFATLRPRRIVVIGAADHIASLASDLSLTAVDTVMRYPVDHLDDDLLTAHADGDLMQLDWLRSALARGADEMIVTEPLPPDAMPALVRLLESRGVKLAIAPMRVRPNACDFTMRRNGSLALVYPRSLAICTPGAETARRAFDLALAIPALVVLLPLLIIIAIAVRLDSAGPALYSQRRVGRLGKTFDILKFRTMRPDAEATCGPVWAAAGEARTTRVGRVLRRLSLDELPQLFNVVRGDMSIVGPRPERPFYVEQFRKTLPRYDERHLVRPGITGWSHVNMARNVDPSAIGERLGYDLFYLEHWSIFMDILIICKTGAEFLFHTTA